jgi:hypothetical protein
MVGKEQIEFRKFDDDEITNLGDLETVFDLEVCNIHIELI